MKKVIGIVVFALLVFAFTSTFSEIGASEAVAQTTGKKSSAKLLRRVSGQVTAVDREKNLYNPWSKSYDRQPSC